MKLLHHSTLGDLTRGGQLLIHFLRMLGQVLKKFSHVILLLIVLIGVLCFMLRTDPHHRYLAFQYGVAEAKLGIFRNPNEPSTIALRDGTEVQTTVGEIANSPTMDLIWKDILAEGMAALVVALISVFALCFAIIAFIYKTGWNQRQEEHLRGGEVIDAAAATKLLRSSGCASDVTLGGVPIVRDTETSHILVAGTTGSGKTQLLQELLRSIRARGERVICFSPSGDFISAFYREGTDVVLNPFDNRCPRWNLWGDCPNPYDYDALAAALIPNEGKADPFWNNAARKVLSSAAMEFQRRKREDLQALLEILTVAPLEDLHRFLNRTQAGPLLDPASEKTAVSVRSNVASYVSALHYLPETGEPFGLRNWARNGADGQWVFLNAADDQLQSVRPLLSMWLEILTNALLSLPESRTRRIWLVIDELPALQTIPSLEHFLARARKHGGCAVLAIQGMSQLEDRYQREGAQTITNLCNTWVAMAQKDPNSAKWLANSFGQVEVVEANQGLSYGANEMRDGVTLTNQRKLRDLVLPSEILGLAPLSGILRLAGSLPDGEPVPAARFQTKYVKMEKVAESFIPSPNTRQLMERVLGGAPATFEHPDGPTMADAAPEARAKPASETSPAVASMDAGAVEQGTPGVAVEQSAPPLPMEETVPLAAEGSANDDEGPELSDVEENLNNSTRKKGAA